MKAKSLFLKLPRARCCLALISAKFSRKYIFSPKVFAKTCARICQNLTPSKYFHKNGPFVSDVAAKFYSFG
jgi:hypothetical protein